MTKTEAKYLKRIAGRNDAGVSVKSLAKFFKMTDSNAYAALNNLLKKGLVTKSNTRPAFFTANNQQNPKAPVTKIEPTKITTATKLSKQATKKISSQAAKQLSTQALIQELTNRGFDVSITFTTKNVNSLG